MGKIKNFFNKVNNMSPAAKASFWFVVSNIALKGISFITTPIFTRIMDVSDYGITSVFVTWEGVISIFASLSLAGGVYNVAMTKYPDDIDMYTSSMMGLTFIATTIVYAFCIGFNILFPSVFELDTSFLIFMAIQSFTNAMVSFWLARERFNYRYKKVILYSFINSILSPLFAILGVLLLPIDKAYAKVVGGGILGIIIGIFFVFKYISKSRAFFNRVYWKYALKFNLPLIPHYLSATILHASDKLMLNSMIDAESAGIYSIAGSIAGLITLVTSALTSAIIPYTLKTIKEEKFSNLRSTICICQIIIGFVCAVVVLFAKEGVLIFATIDYLDAVNILPPLLFASYFGFISGILGNVFMYHEKTWCISFCTIISAIINVLLNYFGIKKFGYIAAGYTTLICQIVGLTLGYIFFRKYEKNAKKIFDLKSFFLITAIFSAVMIISIILKNELIYRIIFAVVLIIIAIIFRKKIINGLNGIKNEK